MDMFIINGERIEADDEHQARMLYSKSVKVDKEVPLPEIAIPANIQKLVLPQWLKEEIVKQEYTRLFKKSLIVIRGGVHDVLEIETFDTQKEMDNYFRDNYSGDDYTSKYIIQNGKTYEISIDVKLSYKQIKKIPRGEE